MRSDDHASTDRRDFLTAAGAAVLMAGTWWAAPSKAHGADSSPPRAGQEVRCASTARGVELRTLTGSGTADIDCTMRLRVEADPGEPSGTSWRLRMLEHRMQGDSARFGRITITEEAEPRSLPASTLRLADAKAPRYELRLVCPRLTVEVEHVLPGLLHRIGPRLLGSVPTTSGPATLITTAPLVLENDQLTSWNPHRQTLASRQPVGLAFAGLPGVTVATIEPFTVLAEHSEHSEH